MLDAISESQKAALQLRGSLFTLSVLQIQESNLKAIESELKLLIRQAPKFFDNAPIVIDVQRLADETLFDLTNTVEIARRLGMLPIGIRGGSESLQAVARSLSLAYMGVSKTEEQPQITSGKRKESNKRSTKTIDDSQDHATNNLIITKPVRSGQQVYAKGGDLIIVGQVSHGAELLADGSIHVYGPLRGRALAGINGNTKARIFCQEMDADLISIAGRYIVNETLIKRSEKVPQQVILTEDGKLLIQPL